MPALAPLIPALALRLIPALALRLIPALALRLIPALALRLIPALALVAGLLAAPTAQPAVAGPACTPLTTPDLVALVIGAALREPTPGAGTRALAGRAGTVVLLGSAIETTDQVRRLVAEIDAGGPAGLPPLVAVDEEGGRVARFGRSGLTTHLPSARTQASTGTPAEVRAAAATLGSELAALGVDLDLGPVLDLSDDPADGVIGDRSFSPDPGVAGAYGAAFAEGLADAGIATTGKHFPDHGLTTVDTHGAVASVTVDRATLTGRHLEPYRLAAAALDSIMLSHLQVSSLDPALPASLAPAAVRMIREDLAFDRVVMTDDLSMQAVASIADQPTAAAMAITAGADLVLVGSPDAAAAVHDRLGAAVAEGSLPLERLREAGRRVLALHGVGGADASCRLGLPPVSEARAVHDGRGTAWAVVGGALREVPDPETRAALPSAPVRYSDEEIASAPRDRPLVTVRRFVPAIVSPPDADPLDVAVARAVAAAGGGAARAVVMTDPSDWAHAVAAILASGGTPVLPPATASRLAGAVSRAVAEDGLVLVVGHGEVPAGGRRTVVLATDDPVAAALEADDLAPPGRRDRLVIADPAAGTALLMLLPLLAGGSTRLLLSGPSGLDPRIEGRVASHRGDVWTLGLDEAVARRVGGEALPGDVAGLTGWLHRRGGAQDNLVVHASPAHLLSALPLASTLGAIPVPSGPDGTVSAGIRAAIGGLHLPAGATRVLFAAGADPTPLLSAGVPAHVARPARKETDTPSA